MEIRIVEGNASNIRLEFDSEGIKPMLSSYYTFEINKAKFHPKVRKGIWDGKIRMFESKTNLFPAGLVFSLRDEFCKNYGIDLIDDCGYFKFYSPHDPKELGKLVKGLNLPFPLYEHQIKPILHAIKNQRCLIESPTNSGKSLIIYVISEFLKTVTDGKILIVVPRGGLVTQMCKDFVDYNGPEPYKLYDGAPNVGIENRVIVATWQTLQHLDKEWFDRQNFSGVMVDEVHEAEGKTLGQIMESLPETYWRIGLTGTLKDSKTSLMVLQSRFGPDVKFITSKELIDKGISSQLKINCLVLDYDQSFKDELIELYGQKYTYQDEIKFLLTCKERNDFIVNTANLLKGNTIVLFNQIAHGKHLYEKLKAISKVPVYYVAGETDDDQRELVKHLAENTDCKIVASIGVFGMGISIKRLHYLLNAHPNKSKTQVLQGVGRILRKSPDGRMSTIMDIADDLSTRFRINFSLKHAEERLRLYALEKFDFVIKKIPLKRKNKTP